MTPGLLSCGRKLSHNGLTGAGRVSDFATHKIEHELGGMFDVAHGAGLASVWGSWARYVYKTNPGRFAQFGEKVFGIDASQTSDSDITDTVLASIDCLGDLVPLYRHANHPH